jgi:hypothetical protein
MKIEKYKPSSEEMAETIKRSEELKSDKVKGISYKELIKGVKLALKKARKKS